MAVAEVENTIICGDCLDIMPDIPDASVDLIVTDPPYGLTSGKNPKGGFMGKAWDKAVPSVELWRECLRVLKPGAFAFVMCIPRQDCLARMICNLEDAGFNVNFSSIFHVFATGFPKSGNVSKLLDRRAGKERQIIGKVKHVNHVERGDSNIEDQLITDRGTIFTSQCEKYITAPATPEAQAFEGAFTGLQLKPALELVLCVMRPLKEKTYIDQALANGHGVTWLDDGRIPWKKGGAPSDQRWGGNSPKGRGDCIHKWMQDKGTPYTDPPQGRFPANLLASDDVLNDGRVTTNNYRPNQQGKVTRTGEFFGQVRSNGNIRDDPNDSGSFSRYFSLDAWSTKNLPESAQRTFPFMIVPKASKREKNAGLDGENNRHVTVKPLKLMSWLITIGSRPGNLILDPFCGSGTTCIAAAILDRRYIGMDLDEYNVDISRRRIAWHVEQAKAEIDREPDLPFGRS